VLLDKQEKVTGLLANEWRTLTSFSNAGGYLDSFVSAPAGAGVEVIGHCESVSLLFSAKTVRLALIPSAEHALGSKS
jgi:hypothetical protein